LLGTNHHIRLLIPSSHPVSANHAKTKGNPPEKFARSNTTRANPAHSRSQRPKNKTKSRKHAHGNPKLSVTEGWNVLDNPPQGTKITGDTKRPENRIHKVQAAKRAANQQRPWISHTHRKTTATEPTTGAKHSAQMSDNPIPNEGNEAEDAKSKVPHTNTIGKSKAQRNDTKANLTTHTRQKEKGHDTHPQSKQTGVSDPHRITFAKHVHLSTRSNSVPHLSGLVGHHADNSCIVAGGSIHRSLDGSGKQNVVCLVVCHGAIKLEKDCLVGSRAM